MSQKATILAALRDGPGTSAEVSAETGIPLRVASAVMHRMWKSGRLYRSANRCRSGVGPGAFVYSDTYRRWTPREDSTLRAMAGRPSAEISARLVRSESAVKHRASALGVSLGVGCKGWTGADIRKLREMADRPRKEIAFALARTVDGVVCQAKRRGIVLTAPRGWDVDTIKKARAMRSRGLSALRIAVRIGAPVSTVEGWVYHGKRTAA